jgi:hypothetical protein
LLNSSGALIDSSLRSFYSGDTITSKRINQDLEPLTFAEFLLQEVLGYVYNARTEMDSATYNNLNTIASLCPSEGGEAVYIARAYLRHVYGYLNWDDDSLCNMGAGSSERRSFVSVVKSTLLPISASHINIYPNPTDAWLNYDISGERVYEHVVVEDITGKICKSVRITSQKGKVDLNSISAGMYLIKFIDTNGFYRTFKINKIQ